MVMRTPRIGDDHNYLRKEGKTNVLEKKKRIIPDAQKQGARPDHRGVHKTDCETCMNHSERNRRPGRHGLKGGAWQEKCFSEPSKTFSDSLQAKRELKKEVLWSK